MTPRAHAILDFLSQERGKRYSPPVVAAVISRNGIPTHPSAAAKTLRKLAKRKMIKAYPTDEAGVLLSDQRMRSQGGQQFGRTPLFDYGIV